ncbi:unnamed protein product [Chondrus crispus]|uniref:Uncharacterized protein n=1 Tax=Chondrus crispus TaxID=2769 RepID=R7Q3R5_CHOCR|nr:unnamed protein product [Chondrus crispus]CDF32669.1 unnamed protein product [Chondrus crispus]|eukprot:XP_005712440.1 unnamed protein product [Chondrus crispus]
MRSQSDDETWDVRERASTGVFTARRTGWNEEVINSDDRKVFRTEQGVRYDD